MKKIVAMKINKELLAFNAFLLVLLFLVSGCARAIEVLPGLCYSDRTGTYVCPLEQGLNLPPKEEFNVPKYDRGKNCSSYTLHEEEWRICMDPDNDHIYDPYYKTRKNLEKRLEQERKIREQQIINSLKNIA